MVVGWTIEAAGFRWKESNGRRTHGDRATPLLHFNRPLFFPSNSTRTRMSALPVSRASTGFLVDLPCYSMINLAIQYHGVLLQTLTSSKTLTIQLVSWVPVVKDEDTFSVARRPGSDLNLGFLLNFGGRCSILLGSMPRSEMLLNFLRERITHMVTQGKTDRE